MAAPTSTVCTERAVLAKRGGWSFFSGTGGGGGGRGSIGVALLDAASATAEALQLATPTHTWRDVPVPVGESVVACRGPAASVVAEGEETVLCGDGVRRPATRGGPRAMVVLWLSATVDLLVWQARLAFVPE